MILAHIFCLKNAMNLEKHNSPEKLRGKKKEIVRVYASRKELTLQIDSETQMR